MMAYLGTKPRFSRRMTCSLRFIHAHSFPLFIGGVRGVGRVCPFSEDGGEEAAGDVVPDGEEGAGDGG